jgi:stearoyl-CoA desaturase (delta-9 desaturase)
MGELWHRSAGRHALKQSHAYADDTGDSKEKGRPTVTTQDRDWVSLAFLVLSPPVAFISVGAYLYHEGFHGGDLITFLFMMGATGLSITAGYHLYYSHRNYECHFLLQLFYLVFGAATLQNSVLRWASNHRYHHRFVDQAGDPYNVRKGIFWAHMGWAFYKYTARPAQGFANIPDLEADRLARWQNRYYWPLGLGVSCGLPFLLGYVFGRPWGGFVWGGLLRVVLILHCSFLINSAAHRFGSQPYSDKNSSRDNWWLPFLTFGAGYHNYHHTFPGDYRNGVAWYHWDPTKWWIWSLHLVGLTWNLHRIPEQAIAKARMSKALLKDDSFLL